MIMNIRDLQYLVAVADLKHFGKAAEQCHVSQPTLSGQIKKLEEQLNVTLFERTNRRVMLTEVGERIAASARQIMRDVDSIHDIAQSFHDPFSGTLRLGAFPTLASYIFPSLVADITEALPDLRLILIEEKTAKLIEQLHTGEIDAALLALPIDEDFLHCEALFDDAFMLAVPPKHPLTKHATIDQSMLSGHSLLLLKEGHCLRDQALDICQRYEIGEAQDFRATSLETLRSMVKAGTGITFMPKIAITDDDSAITYLSFTTPPMRSIGLVWRKSSARVAIMERLVELY